MPRRCQRTGLCLSISDYHAHDQIRIVEGSAERMRDAVAKLSTLMNRSWHLGRAMTSQLAREGEGPEQFQHSGFVRTLLRINLGICPFQITVRNHGSRAMAGA